MAARSGVSVTSTLHQARQADGCQVGSQCKNCLAVSSSIRKRQLMPLAWTFFTERSETVALRASTQARGRQSRQRTCV